MRRYKIMVVQFLWLCDERIYIFTSEVLFLQLQSSFQAELRYSQVIILQKFLVESYQDELVCKCVHVISLSLSPSFHFLLLSPNPSPSHSYDFIFCLLLPLSFFFSLSLLPALCLFLDILQHHFSRTSTTQHMVDARNYQ